MTPNEPRGQRANDQLILYKLDQLAVNNQKLHDKIDEHVSKTNSVIHGNGVPGLKTTVEVLKTRMVLLWGTMGVALSAIINDYFNRG
jgi:putative ribosome biogenesis GTPase RsgA